MLPVGSRDLTGAAASTAKSAQGRGNGCQYRAFAGAAVARKIAGERRAGAGRDQTINCHRYSSRFAESERQFTRV